MHPWKLLVTWTRQALKMSSDTGRPDALPRRWTLRGGAPPLVKCSTGSGRDPFQPGACKHVVTHVSSRV